MATIRETISKDPRITEVWSEEDQGQGMWASLATGWCSSLGTHQLHEYTWTDLRQSLAGVADCQCEDCLPCCHSKSVYDCDLDDPIGLFGPSRY